MHNYKGVRLEEEPAIISQQKINVMLVQDTKKKKKKKKQVIDGTGYTYRKTNLGCGYLEEKDNSIST